MYIFLEERSREEWKTETGLERGRRSLQSLQSYLIVTVVAVVASGDRADDGEVRERVLGGIEHTRLQLPHVVSLLMLSKQWQVTLPSHIAVSRLLGDKIIASASDLLPASPSPSPPRLATISSPRSLRLLAAVCCSASDPSSVAPSCSRI